MSTFGRIAISLEKIGLRICHDSCPIRSADDLATRIDVAARSYAAGKRKADREQADDGDALDALPPGAIPEGRWD